MSQETTIPAGTAVMTGTPAGVDAFQSPKSFLGDGDKIEVAVSGVDTLRNTVRFEELGWVRFVGLKIFGIVLRIFT
ncbi:hypothetical protein MBLNU13_g04526t1 [Cladosporium sp. NU13]